MVMSFRTWLKHLVPLKINNHKIILAKLYFRQYYVSRKVDFQGLVRGTKDPDPGDPRRPDSTGSGSATLLQNKVMDI